MDVTLAKELLDDHSLGIGDLSSLGLAALQVPIGVNEYAQGTYLEYP